VTDGTKPFIGRMMDERPGGRQEEGFSRKSTVPSSTPDHFLGSEQKLIPAGTFIIKPKFRVT
jgi:hypothetical protein